MSQSSLFKDSARLLLQIIREGFHANVQNHPVPGSLSTVECRKTARYRWGAITPTRLSSTAGLRIGMMGPMVAPVPLVPRLRLQTSQSLNEELHAKLCMAVWVTVRVQ